jgi:uncharacterized YigZ family protein
MLEDTYRTITAEGEGLFKDKGSKFISKAFPVENEKTFHEKLLEIKKSFHDARHHCYAYMLGNDKSSFRSSDDGEPSGTAGKPILNQILSANLTNIGIVVVRYFGGTKLGVSGLINAYKTAARQAIDKAPQLTKTINELYSLQFEYPLMNEVMRIMKEENLDQLNPRLELNCYLEISIRKMEADRVVEKFKNVYGMKLDYLGTH